MLKAKPESSFKFHRIRLELQRKQNGPSTKPSRAPSSNPSNSPSLRPSAVPSTFPSENPSYSLTPEPIDIVLRWIYCSGPECRCYVQNVHPSDEYIITSMTIDWPQSPSTGNLPDLRQVRKGSVRLCVEKGKGYYSGTGVRDFVGSMAIWDNQ
mmetsp:Transcript_4649/g.8558  ORF Transcript_4649/g.8558 Transcript_4649/m.8558 type:complete len:153 (-) Transcript_4649:82-540(-)